MIGRPAPGPLSRPKVEAHLADTAARIEAQRLLVERLDQLHDDERRELTRMEHQDTQFRRLVEERGLVDE